MVAIAPNPIICVLAGASKMKTGIFFALNLSGTIVTIDDVAVRAGDLDLAQRVTAEVAKGAIPEFFFHRRGG